MKFGWGMWCGSGTGPGTMAVVNLWYGALKTMGPHRQKSNNEIPAHFFIHAALYPPKNKPGESRHERIERTIYHNR